MVVDVLAIALTAGAVRLEFDEVNPSAQHERDFGDLRRPPAHASIEPREYLSDLHELFGAIRWLHAL